MTTLSETTGRLLRDVAKRINIQWFRWLVIRMDEDAAPRRVLDALVDDHRRKARPRSRWKNQVKGAMV